MKQKIFYWVKKSLFFMMALMSLLSLCFVVLEFKDGTSIFRDTGFSLLNFKSSVFIPLEELTRIDYYGTHTFFGIFSIVQLVYSVSAILVAIYIFLKKQYNGMQLYVLIGTLFFAVANMIIGIVFRSVWLNEVSEVLGVDRDTFVMYLKTKSFVPLIIQGCFFIMYLALIYLEKQSKLSNGVESNTLQQQETVIKVFDNQSVKTTHIADELIKLKELLDSGVITQEEFDFKKKQLLGM